MKVLICESNQSSLRALTEAIAASRDFSVVAVARTGRETIEVLNSGEVDIAIHSRDTVAIPGLIRSALVGGVASSVRRILATDNPSAPLVVRAHQFGFDGLVGLPDSAKDLSLNLLEVLSGRASLADHPIVRRLGLTAGMMDRTLVYADDFEAHVADLLGLGLTDDEVSDALSAPIQRVRNSIAAIIEANGLRTRTQLCVLHAVNVQVPEFAS